MPALFDFSAVLERSATGSAANVALSALTLELLSDALVVMTSRDRWGSVDDATFDQIEAAVSAAFADIYQQAEPEGVVHIGAMIIHFDLSAALPVGCLPCDGTVFTKTAYPDLYQYFVDVGSGDIIDSESARTPDLANTSVFYNGIGSIPCAWCMVSGLPNE